MRRLLASLIIGLSLLIASASWSGFVMLRTTLNADRSEEVADALLDDPEVKEAIAGVIANQTAAQLPEGTLSDTQIEELSLSALDDPTVERILRDEIVGMHKRVLQDEPSREVNADSSELGSAGGSFLSEAAPQLENVLPADFKLPLGLDTNGLNPIAKIKTLLETWVPTGLAISTVGVLLGFVIADRRKKVLRRLAFWCFGAAIFWLVLGVGLPWILGKVATDATVIAAALSGALFKAMLYPAVGLAVLGVALLTASYIWPDRSSTKTKSQKDQDKAQKKSEDKADKQAKKQQRPDRPGIQDHRDPYQDKRDERVFREPPPPRDDFRRYDERR